MKEEKKKKKEKKKKEIPPVFLSISSFRYLSSFVNIETLGGPRLL
jgi:hypothetical protein